METAELPLESVCDRFYAVLGISSKGIEAESNKQMKEKINYRLKNLPIYYPELKFYGPENFTLPNLYHCPDVLITPNDEDLKAKLESKKKWNTTYLRMNSFSKVLDNAFFFENRQVWKGNLRIDTFNFSCNETVLFVFFQSIFFSY